MKKLMTLMLGMSMFLGATAVVFGDTPTDTTKKTAKTKKAKKAKKTDTTK